MQATSERAAPPPQNGIAGVIFDFDGTLYSPPSFFKARVAFACRTGIGILKHLGRAQAALRGRELESGEALVQELYRLLAERSGVSADRVRVWFEGRFMPAFVGVLKQSAKPRPGLLPLLEQLAARGVASCVLSDYGHVQERCAALGLQPSLFRDCRSTVASGALKPSPRSFLELSQRLRIPPARWLVVGDREDTDGQAASAAGMRFLGLSDRPKAPGFYPWEIVRERLLRIPATTQSSARS